MYQHCTNTGHAGKQFRKTLGFLAPATPNSSGIYLFTRSFVEHNPSSMPHGCMSPCNGTPKHPILVTWWLLDDTSEVISRKVWSFDWCKRERDESFQGGWLAKTSLYKKKTSEGHTEATRFSRYLDYLTLYRKHKVGGMTNKLRGWFRSMSSSLTCKEIFFLWLGTAEGYAKIFKSEFFIYI